MSTINRKLKSNQLMDSESTNLYKTSNVTAIASSASGGINGDGEEVDALAVAHMSRLKLKETVGPDQCSKGDFRLKLMETLEADQCSKGDFRCRICGSHAVKHVGGSRDCRRLRETKHHTLHMLRFLGVPWVDLHRSEFFAPYNFEEKKVSNSEKNVSTKKKNKGKKESTKKKGKKSSDRGKEKKSSDSD